MEGSKILEFGENRKIMLSLEEIRLPTIWLIFK